MMCCILCVWLMKCRWLFSMWVVVGVLLILLSFVVRLWLNCCKGELVVSVCWMFSWFCSKSRMVYRVNVSSSVLINCCVSVGCS